MLLAVLPKRNSDDVSGELLVAAYQRHLGHLSGPAISFMADEVMRKCQWFPTIAECLEIAAEHRRNDDDTARRTAIQARVFKEREQREIEDRVRHAGSWQIGMTQEFIDSLSPSIVNIGLACKSLRRDDSGRVVLWFAKPGEEPEF
jgi:flagellum-specific peptidoglycan hydrolase FlgJ